MGRGPDGPVRANRHAGDAIAGQPMLGGEAHRCARAIPDDKAALRGRPDQAIAQGQVIDRRGVGVAGPLQPGGDGRGQAVDAHGRDDGRAAAKQGQLSQQTRGQRARRHGHQQPAHQQQHSHRPRETKSPHTWNCRGTAAARRTGVAPLYHPLIRLQW